MTVDLSKLLTAQGRKDAEWVLSFAAGSEWHTGAFRPNREAELVRVGVLVETDTPGVFTVGPRPEPAQAPAIILDEELRAAAQRIIGLRGPADLGTQGPREALGEMGIDLPVWSGPGPCGICEAPGHDDQDCDDSGPAGAPGRGRRAYRDAPSR